MRVKKTVIGMCNLCFEQKELIKGHIMPKWSSRLDGGLRSTYMHVNNILTWRETTQGKTGEGLVAEYLFCETCDNSLGKGEGLLREIVHPSSNKSHAIPRVYDFVLELNDNKQVEDLYRAVGGLLLKTHLSKQEAWKDFLLTKKQRNLVFNGIKNSNLSKNISLTLYKIYNLDELKLSNHTDEIEDLKRLFPHDFQYGFPPYLSGDGIFSTIFVFGGLIMEIDFYTKGYTRKWGKQSSSQEIHKFAILPMDIRYLIDDEGEFAIPDPDKINWDLLMDEIVVTPLEGLCPCRVYYTNEGRKENLSYRDCCYQYWDFSFWRNQTENYYSKTKEDLAKARAQYSGGINRVNVAMHTR